MSIVRLSVWTVLAMVALETEARAEPNVLEYQLDIDGPIALASGIGWIRAITLREAIGPTTCRWCATNSFDLAARHALLWGDPIAAQRVVEVVGFGIGPAFIFGADFLAAWHDRSWQRSIEDAVLIAEAAAIASDVNLVLRFSIARERPWASVLTPAEKAEPQNRTADANMSFFSGHATFLFAMATAAGTIATMRGYRWTPMVWLVGLPFAFAASYLRIASDDHWMSDVLVGVAAGTAMGVAIPYFAHKRVKLVPTGSTLSLVGTF